MIADSYLNHNTTSADLGASHPPELHAGFFLPHLKPGMRVLHCGCRSGAVTLLLAQRVEGGEVIGIDPDTNRIEAASSLAAGQGCANARFRTARLQDLPFSDGIFDAVLVHTGLERQPDPLRAITEMGRVLRPGGLLGARGPDWGGCLATPSTPDVDLALEQYQRLLFERGDNPYLGRQLRALLRSAGFTNIVASASYECYDDIAPVAEHFIRQLDAGLLSHDPDGESDPDSADEAPTPPRNRHGEALRAWGRHPDAFFAHAWCEAIGKKAAHALGGDIPGVALLRSDL